MNKDFQTYLALSAEKAISGMVGSHQSWGLPNFVLNLSLIIKSWSVLVKIGLYDEEALAGGGGKDGGGGFSEKKLGAWSDSNGVIFNSTGRKI